MKTSPDLITQAGHCRFYQGDLLDLGAALPPDDDDLDTLLETVVTQHGPPVMDFLMLAALAVDRPVDARHLITAAGRFEHIGTLIVIAGHCRGDRAAAMLAAHRSGHMSWEREAVALVVAAWHCRVKDQAWPVGMITDARVLARRVITPEARSAILAAAHLLDDDDLWQILDPESSPGMRRTGEEIAQGLIMDMTRPILDIIPDMPPPVVMHGGTIQRAVARVGRNEPCPCGSGKKYKRCCQDEDNERLRDSSDVAGVTRQEQREAPEVYLTADRLWDMRAHEVVALDPARIPLELHGSYLNRLIMFEEFEAVLAYVEANSLENDYEGHIVEAVGDAMRTQKPELARRLAAHVPDFDTAEAPYPLNFQFARDQLEHGPALELIEAAAMANLDRLSPTDFICQLFDVGCPALGILAGRGAIAYSDLWEAETVLSHLLEARDRLELPPFDFAEDLFEHRLAERASTTSRSARGTDGYEQLQAVTTRARELEKKLAAKERALKTAQQAAIRKQRLETAKSAAPDKPASTAKPDAKVAELESDITGLKQEVKRVHQDRNRYRRKFKDAVADQESAVKENREIRAELEANLAASEAIEDDAPELLLAEAVAASYSVRVPVYTNRFTAELDRLPEAVARKAVHLSGRLAAGEEAAFQGAKRLAVNRKIIRQRLGVYRLLFRLEANELVVLECVHRRDLERAAGRYS